MIGHVGSRRALALGILEDVGLIELDLSTKRERLRKVLFGLAGKSDNDIGGEADRGLDRAQFLNDSRKRSRV